MNELGCQNREHGHITEKDTLECTIKQLQAELKLHREKCTCGVTAAINVRNGYQENQDE